MIEYHISPMLIIDKTNVKPSKTVNVSVANPRTSPSMITENVMLCCPLLNVEVLKMYGEEPITITNNMIV